jgi:hypothetical protein
VRSDHPSGRLEPVDERVSVLRFWDSLTLSAGSPLCRSLVAPFGVRREFGLLAVRAG